MPETKIRPGAGWYLLPVLLAVAAMVIASVQGYDEATQVDDRISSIGADGTGEVTLEAGTEPSVFAEFAGATAEGITAPPVQLSVTGPDGDAVDVSGASGRQTWEIGNSAAIKVGGFHADDAGTYEVVVEGAGNGVSDWSVGDLDIAASIWRVARWLVIGLPLALVALVVIILRRHSAKKRARAIAASSVLAQQPGAGSMGTPLAPPTGSAHGSGPFS